MARLECWKHGSYEGWVCPGCARERQHREEVEAVEEAAQQQAEQAARHAELLERQTAAIEEAAAEAQMAADEAAEQQRQTTANAWKLQSQAKSERAHSLCGAGMYDEAYRLAVQSIEQDPGNLDGFWVAASSLISLRLPDKARFYLEKLIQVLSLPEYRYSPEYFVQVLGLLSKQNDLFLLRETFSCALRMNVGYWHTSAHAVVEAHRLTALLTEMEMLTEAKSILEFELQAGLPEETLNSALTLLKKLIGRGDFTSAGKIADVLSARSACLLAESYVCEIYSLLGRDNKTHIDAFVRGAKIDSRRAIESDVARIRKTPARGELSPDTVACVMGSVSEKYRQWKSEIETQIRDAAVASAKSAQVKTGASWCGVLSFFVLLLAYEGYWYSQGFRSVSGGPFALFGAILVGSLYGRYVKRLRIAQITRNNVTSAFSEENRRLGELGLPTLTPPSQNGSLHLFELLIYTGIIIGYVGVWFSLMAGQNKPSMPGSAKDTLIAPMGARIFIDELTSTSLGNAYGISWTNGIGNHGAVFSAANASRIEYPGKIPRQGTIELWIKVDSGYLYENYAFRERLDTAMIFSTDAGGGDVTWPGTTKFYVSRNGNVSLYVAKFKYNQPPTRSLDARGTPFRFGEWHAIGFSVGSVGQFIIVDGKVVAADPNRTQEIGCSGTHTSPADIPTVGETVSHYWPHHQYEAGFEGIVARFRASPKQRDWKLAQGIATTNGSANGKHAAETKSILATREDATARAENSGAELTHLNEAGSVDNGIYKVGGNVSAPIPLYKPDPAYTEAARAAKFQGNVSVVIVVDALGTVSDAHVVKSLGMGLDEKAVETIKTWKFRPAMRNGAPVAVRVTVDVSFRLF